MGTRPRLSPSFSTQPSLSLSRPSQPRGALARTRALDPPAHLHGPFSLSLSVTLTPNYKSRLRPCRPPLLAPRRPRPWPLSCRASPPLVVFLYGYDTGNISGVKEMP